MVHAAFEEENKHLNQVMSSMDDKEKELREKIKGQNLKNLGDIPIKRKIADEDVALEQSNIYKNRLNRIINSRTSPYFGRVDIKFDDEPRKRAYYIGKMGVDLDDENLNIIDWRTPIGDAFYKGGLGEFEVEVEEKRGKSVVVKGKKYLKRAIDIKDKKITKITDMEVAVEKGYEDLIDSNLLECLDGTSDIRLKEIVATIQEEQNRIIREDVNKTVYIQGCAGSGKTTIALHRVAYLIFKNNLKDEDILVIAPNKLFIDYISSTLPDLGSKDVKQLTYRQFAESVLDDKVPIMKDNEEEISIKSEEEIDLLKIKGSIKFKKIIDNYIDRVIDELIPNQSISIFGEVLYSHDDLKEIFNKQFSVFKLNEGLSSFKTFIEKSSREKLLAIIKGIKEKYKKELDYFAVVFKDNPSDKNYITNIEIERDSLIKRVEKYLNIVLDEYFKKFKRLSFIQCYLELMSNRGMLSAASEGIIDNNYIDKLIMFTSKGLTEQDIPPMLYLYCRLNDIKSRRFRHIVVDESQDLSPFELYTLNEFAYASSFTILGDVNQSIVPYKDLNKDTLSQVFESNKNTMIYNLNRSYRSSYEIIMLARELISGTTNPEYVPIPIKRHGPKPIVINRNTDQQITEEILKHIKLEHKNIRNIAIIFKTVDRCYKAYETLKNSVSLNIVTAKSSEYKGGITIIPAYLTKGLEFDMVIIPDADSTNYGDNKLDRNLLYVQVTRALHSLIILYKDKITPLLERISSDFYEDEETERDKQVKLKSTKEILVMLIKTKFGSIPIELEDKINNEKDYKKIQQYIEKVALEKDIKKLLA